MAYPHNQEEELVSDILSGRTNRQIANKYGCNTRTVRKWKTKLRKQGKLPPAHSQENQRYKVKFEEDGNYAKASSTSERITSLDALIKAVGVDLDVWEVERHRINKWEVGANVRTGALEWAKGVMDGNLEYHGLNTQDLWSVEAWFRRKVLRPLFVTIEPVVCKTPRQIVEVATTKGVQSSLISTDHHFGFSRDLATGKLTPFHDRLALDVFTQVAALLQPERIDLLGDTFDFASMSDKYLRSPELEYTIQPAILEAYWFIKRLREVSPNSKITIHEGNHDAWIDKAVKTHLRAAYGIRPADEMEMSPPLSPDRLLGLESLGVRWIGDYPNDIDWLNDNLKLLHGETANSPPGATARAIIQRSDHSVIFGHIHRNEMATRKAKGRDGDKMITAYCPGCLCRIDGVVPAKSKQNNWRQGLAVVQYTDTQAAIEDIPIHDGAALWNGNVVHGRDYVSELCEAFPERPW